MIKTSYAFTRARSALKLWKLDTKSHALIKAAAELPPAALQRGTRYALRPAVALAAALRRAPPGSAGKCGRALEKALEAIGTGDVWAGRHPAEREAAIKLAGGKDNEEADVKPGVDRATQNRGACRSPGGAGRIGSPAGQDALGSLARRGRIGSPAGRGRIGSGGEAGRKQKLKVDYEKENTFSYVNNKDMAAGAGHADAGAGLGSQIPQDR